MATEEDLAAAKVQAMIRGRSSRKSLPPRDVAAQPCLVVTGPGGLGKHKLVRQLVANYGDEFARPVSHTTRAPRKGEVHGVDYFFISFERMKTLIGRGLFAEHTEVEGHLYGTAHSAMKTVARSGRSCAMAVNVDGAQQLHRSQSLAEGSLVVFIAPRSMAALEAKLRARGTETERGVRSKLHRAREELALLTPSAAESRGQTCLAEYARELSADDALQLGDELLALAADVRPLTLSMGRLKGTVSQLGASSSGQLAFLTLSLRGAQLSELPLLAGYQHLQRLELSDSRLTSLGGEICGLASLLYLAVDGNRLSGTALAAPLPVSLRSLDASRNALSSMQGVGRLVRLEQLLLEHNQIEEIAELTQHASLAVLGLGHNRVRAQSLHLPPSLRELHLGHNQIDSLASLPPLPQLQTLDASHNQLSVLAELHTKCPVLTELRLGHNQLSDPTILAPLGALGGLRQLDLRANPLPDGYMLDALYPLLALLELDGEIVTPEDKVRAMNQKGGAALERLAEIRNHHLPPEGFAEERAAQHAAATQMQATFRGHHQRSEAQRIHEEEVTGALTVQSRFRGNRERELTEAYFNRVA